MLEGRHHRPDQGHRTALQNAASIAGLMLTTEALIAEIKEKEKAGGGGGCRRRRHGRHVLIPDSPQRFAGPRRQAGALFLYWRKWADPSGGRVSGGHRALPHPEETVRAARAVAESAPETEILVVDNASGDRIEADLAAAVPAARLVAEPSNRGFGAACNRGARESARPYILFLNSDAYVRPGAVAALVAALDAAPGAAAAAPRLSNPDGSLQRSIQRLPTPWRIFCESAGLAFLSGGRRAVRRPLGDAAGPRAAAIRPGGRWAPRSSCGAAAFDAAGGFDENFFLYAEETDLLARWQGMRPRAPLRAAAPRSCTRGARSAGDRLFGAAPRLARPLCGEAPRSGWRALAARASLSAGAALRYATALLTPGERGRVRRARYRAALSGARQ